MAYKIWATYMDGQAYYRWYTDLSCPYCGAIVQSRPEVTEGANFTVNPTDHNCPNAPYVETWLEGQLKAHQQEAAAIKSEIADLPTTYPNALRLLNKRLQECEEYPV